MIHKIITSNSFIIIYIGVFRTLPSICIGDFWENNSRLRAFIFFAKILYHRCLIGSQIRICPRCSLSIELKFTGLSDTQSN